MVLGSGWAGYALTRTLSASKKSRVVISPRSHFVFTPLLASTAVGTLEFRAAIEPVRRLAVDEFHQAWASSIDFANKKVHLEANTSDDPTVGAKTGVKWPGGPKFSLSYDKLVVAVGCYSQTFGIEGVVEHANFLRDAGDARDIRSRVLSVFEKADLPTTRDEEKRQMLHFAIVGGGPTGIEFAAELHDLVHEDLSKLYPGLMKFVAITIYDIAPKVLPMFDQNLASYAMDRFRRQGIQVKTEHHLERIRREEGVLKIRIKEEPEEVAAGLVVWSTGLMQNPLVGQLAEQDIEGHGKIFKDSKTGGITTDDHLRVLVKKPDGEPKVLPNVYALGDCAVIQGKPLPATAQVASQQAVWLGRRLNKNDLELTEGFKFKNWGTMAYLGGSTAIHQSSADELKGWPAWILWRTAYLTRSMSLRNKLMIPVHWAVTWLFGRDISRF